MFKLKFENLKNIIKKKTEGNNKQNIENLVVFLILLIITIIAINTIWGEKETNEEKKGSNSSKVLAEYTNNENISSNISEVTEYDLQKDIEDILSKMEGVGKVQVLITYSETSSTEAMYNENKTVNTTEETDSNGGTRKIESSDVSKEIITDNSNLPITQKIVLPKIEGAIVIAEGGGDAMTKTNIVQAVVAVTGLSTYKVQVFEMKS